MKDQHTPGPLEIRHGTNIMGKRRDTGHVGVVANTGGHYSGKVDCTPENEANALLFKVAPDMLALLREYHDITIHKTFVELRDLDHRAHSLLRSLDGDA